jgi:hypothetical protein
MRDRSDLTALDAAFAAAEMPTATAVPDGWYTVVVDDVALRHTRRTGRPLLCWKLRIVSALFTGRRLWRHQVLGRATLGWLKHDLRLCGLALPRLSALPDYLARLRGVQLEVTKQTRDDYAVVLFRRRPAPP